MAEVRKRENVKEYKIAKKTNKKVTSNKKEEVKTVKKKPSQEGKKSLWIRFRIFCHGVRTEVSKVHWTTKKDMLKYSISTIVFVVFCSLFFYLINVIFALIQSLF